MRTEHGTNKKDIRDYTEGGVSEPSCSMKIHALLLNNVHKFGTSRVSLIFVAHERSTQRGAIRDLKLKNDLKSS